MTYTLDDQLENLCKVIEANLTTGNDPTRIRELMIAQKALLESMVIITHLESLASRINASCDGKDCG